MQSTLACNRRAKLLVLLFPWLVWGMSSLFVTFQMLLQTAPSVMITDLQQAFSVNTFGVSLLSSSFFYTYLLLQIPAGMLIDRVHPRYCLTICLMGIAGATVIFALAPSLNVARGGRILQGVFSAPSVVPALYLAAIWFPAQRFALLAGLTEMIGMLGAALGQAILAPCVGAYGWRTTLLICASFGLFMAVMTWFIVKESKPNAAEEVAKPKAAKPSVFKNLFIVISYPQAWINGIFSGILFAISAAFGSLWCIPFLMQAYPITLDVAALASAMVLFGVAMGAPSIGWISDRLGLRKLPMIVSTGIVLVLMTIIIYVPNINLEVMFGLLFILGFCSSSYALPFAVMRDIMPENVRGTAMGYTNLMCIFLGAPLLQPLIGWLLNSDPVYNTNTLLAYRHALIALPICLAIGFILAFFIKETHCQPI